MGLLLAAALAAQIHSGSDLLAACKQADTQACDTFILSAADADTCSPPGETAFDKAFRRESVMRFVSLNPHLLKADARYVLRNAYECEY